MNEAIIENYLQVIQDVEPEYMTEGIRDFVAKFDRKLLKRTVDKLHMAFSKGDGRAFEEVTKKYARVAKIPKYQEVKNLMGNFTEEHPEIGQSVELSKKVLKNTFKIRDKAKLEILSNAIGMTSWVKSKGGKTNVGQATKETLKKVHTDVMSIYDSGFENLPENTPEEEELKRKMMENTKKQEKQEMIIVMVVLGVLAAAIVWAGITIWGIITSPVVGIIGTIILFLTMLFKFAVGYLAIAAPIVVSAIIFLKSKGA